MWKQANEVKQSEKQIESERARKSKAGSSEVKIV